MASRQEILNIIANDEQLSAVTAAVFTQADTDGSGHINRSELKTALVDVANGLNIPLLLRLKSIKLLLLLTSIGMDISQ